MILEKINENNKTKALYDSSNIASSEYDTINESLTVIFKNGGSYTYNNVPKTDYVRFETAESQGKVLNSVIKRYSFTKNDSVDVNKIINEINRVKQDNLISYQKSLIDMMTSIVNGYTIDRTINSDELNKLYRSLETYNNEIV